MADPQVSPILQRILDLLRASGADFQLSSHRPVYTSADAAAVRGESLHSGAKALVVKGDDRFVLLILPGDHSLDSKSAKQLLGAKSLRFAAKEEVATITGLEPGAIPPFGSLFGLTTFCDTALAENDQINFNAGTHTESIRIRYQDYVAAEHPALGAFSRPSR